MQSPRPFRAVLAGATSLLVVGLMPLSPAAHAGSGTGEANPQHAAPTHVHYDAPAQFRTPRADGSLAPRLQNLGKHMFPTSQASAIGQLFVNQGLNLAYGFNHLEAGRAFAEAARRDPGNVMALWGQALVLGPNINMPMDPASEPLAFALLQRADELLQRQARTAGHGGSLATQRERDYVAALAKRYTGHAEDRAGSDLAYANAMRQLAQKYPDDLDAQTLFAESLMDLRPWNYWLGDGTPFPETVEIQAALRQVIARNALHPGALHYWIHLWEPTNTPEEAEDEADRLVDLLPAAGHLVHMPGHIFARIGRHQDAIAVNQKAALADEDYITQCRAQGFYPLAYYPHNVHFIWLSATAAGQSALALEMADKTAAVIPDATLTQLPNLQSFKVVPLYARIQFERWDSILAQSKPAYDLAFYRGVWHFARGLAYLGKADRGGSASSAAKAADAIAPPAAIDPAQRELDALQAVLNEPALAEQPATASANSGSTLLRIAERVLIGEMAHAQGDNETAISNLERAVRYEDSLTYNEPSDWPQSVRQRLVRVLLDAGRPSEAEAVYWEDLRRNRENGWALHGLKNALEAQGKAEASTLIEVRLKRAWAAADPSLTASSASTETAAARDLSAEIAAHLAH